MRHAKRITYRFQIKHIGQDCFFHFIVPLLSLNTFLDWLISSYISRFNFTLISINCFCVYIIDVFYHSSFISHILRFIIFIPSSWRYFWWKRRTTVHRYRLDSSILSWFDSLAVLSIPLANCVSFLLLLNFFYPLYIHTRLTPPSPSVAKRRWRHALRHNPHPPT